MLRLHFTAEDLLHTRLAGRPAPLVEMSMALATMQRGDPMFARWSRRTPLSAKARRMFELIPPTATGPLFLDPVSDGFEDGLDRVLSTPPAEARAELRRAVRPASPWVRDLAATRRTAWRDLGGALTDVHDTIVGRDEERLSIAFHSDLAWRAGLLATDGPQAMLTSLYPGSRWSGTTLEVDVPEDTDHKMDGMGLVLLPSVFWTGRPLIGIFPDGSRFLVYPALTPLPLVEPETRDALGVLLGRTRAAALELLTEQRTTTELAELLGISNASASYHAKTLRAAGLVATRRTGKAVRHTCTLLGRRLLNGG